MASFSLNGIVRRASEAEAKDSSLAPYHYWRDASGELEREKRFYRPSTCYLVFCSEADSRASVKIPFRASIPLPSLDECATVTGTAALSCPRTGVHQLLQTWLKLKSSGAEAVLEHDLHEAIRASAADSKTTAFDDPKKYRTGGDLNPRVQDEMRRLWGLDVALELPPPSLERFGRSDLSVDVSVRLADYQEPFMVNVVMDISGLPTSTLRAMATAGREATLKERLKEDVQEYYSTKVALAGLYSDSDYLRRVAALQAILMNRVLLYGRAARLVGPNEARPAPPGEMTETVHLALPSFSLSGEPQPVTVDLTLRLEQVDRATLIKKITALSAKSFNAAFAPEAHAKLRLEASKWTGAMLRRSNRDVLKTALSKAYEPLLKEFGYELKFSDLRTSLDGTAASTSEVFDFQTHVYTTLAPNVAVEIGVKVFLKFHPGSHNRPSHEIKETFGKSLRRATQSILDQRVPSEIYIGWEQPLGGRDSLQDQIRNAIKGLFEEHVEEIDLTLELVERKELLDRRNTILSRTIEREKISLIPDGVPGDILLSVHARVDGLTEYAWERMSHRMDHQGNWDPVKEAQEDFSRILGREFGQIVDSRSSAPLSKEEASKRLGENLATEISKVHHIKITPHVTLHAAPNLIAYWRQKVERERMEIDSYDELEKNLLMAKRHVNAELVKGLMKGDNEADIKQHRDALTKLETEFQSVKGLSASFNNNFSKANYYLQLFSLPSGNMDALKGNLDKGDDTGPKDQE